jgi:hypothetical protein
MKRSGYSQVLPAVASLLLLAAIGCDRNEVKVYQVENPESVAPVPPAAAPGMAMPSTMTGDVPIMDKSSLPPFKYTLPAGWKEKQPSQMRVASFEIAEGSKTLDVSVIPLGGLAGGDFDNVNRWRGQVALGKLPEAELLKLAEKVEVAGQTADLYDAAGSDQGTGDTQRIIGVILHRDDTAWFFKMTGDAELAGKNKAAFISFLKSVEFGGLPAPSTMDMSQLPSSHPPIGTANAAVTAVTTDATGKPEWNVPSGWQEGPQSQFLIAKYIINGSNDARAEVNVSHDGGGLLANVNRWRHTQLGLDTVDESGLSALVSALDANGTPASLVDFTGTHSKTGKAARLIGVVVPDGKQSWFYKLMGDPDVVAAQKDAFTKFVQSAKYSHAH